VEIVAMIVPQRAPVKPRVISPTTGEAIPLEDEIRSFLEAGTPALICLVGPPGSGKTTALRHLAAVLPPSAPVSLKDDAQALKPVPEKGKWLVVCAGKSPFVQSHTAVLPLTSWQDDDAIDYLLTVHKDRCASVMTRLRAAPDRDLLNGTPELWRIVLDHLAADETLARVEAALQKYIDAGAGDSKARERLGAVCIEALTRSGGIHVREKEALKKCGCTEEVLDAVRHETVQVLVACRQIIEDLRNRSPCDYFREPWPISLIRRTAAAVAADPASLAHLRTLVAGFPWKQPLAATLLHVTNTGWRPDEDRLPRLAGAYLRGAEWPGIRLVGADLREADLSQANLQAAVLDRAEAEKVDLPRANCRGASLKDFDGTEANLEGADLSQVQAVKVRFHHANLKGACLEEAVLTAAELIDARLTSASFRGADLTQAVIRAESLEGANFSGARLEKADLTGGKLCQADFTGANFLEAVLVRCDMEEMELPGADFRSANLSSALLTGSRMPGASFANACLRHTGLADIQWEGAILCHADLRGATFHMGSSRSGLVDSYIASEGTRTGFYTDDYEEQYFKNPEEIRKANLRGADLRGAVIDDVDFYLVDLRGAFYDAEQEKHFRRCRAILEDRA
jgi:uncharacterized protein YjbI with pentapeptide repeats